MWADTLLALERAHLVRLLGWSAANILVGTALLLFLVLRNRTRAAPLLHHFAVHTVMWSAIAAAAGLFWWQTLQLREYGGLMRLVNLMWLVSGLEVGLVAVGATLALYAWRTLHRAQLAAVGAGVAMVLQGLALLLLSTGLLLAIGPLR